MSALLWAETPTEKAVWGKPYRTVFEVSGGTPPYTWRGFRVQEMESFSWVYDPVTGSVYRPIVRFTHRLPDGLWLLSGDALIGHPTFDLTNPPYRWADSSGELYLFDLEITDAAGQSIRRQVSVWCELDPKDFGTTLGGVF